MQCQYRFKALAGRCQGIGAKVLRPCRVEANGRWQGRTGRIGEQQQRGLRVGAAQADVHQHDEQLLRRQHLVYDDEAALVASSQEALADLETLFEADLSPDEAAEDDGDAGR